MTDLLVDRGVQWEAVDRCERAALGGSMDISTYAAPLVVTLVYIGIYYATQLNLLVVKLRVGKEHAARGEKFDRYFSQDRTLLSADRMQLNMLEHMPPFLVLLWLHAVFVSAPYAGIAGAVYVGARGLYFLMLGPRLGRGVRASILLATAPGYLVMIYLGGGLVWKLAVS